MISQVTHDIYLAGAIDLLHVSELLEHGITGFLNVAYDLEQPPQFRFFDNAEYVKVGLIDGEGNSPDMLEAARLALKVLLKKHSKVLVYCWGGISRSTTVITYYFMKTQRISFNKALEKIYLQRSIVKINPALEELIRKCQEVFA